MRQTIPERVDERYRKIFPSTLRLVLNRTDELDRAFASTR